MIKRILIKLWPYISRIIPEGVFKEKVNRKIYLKQLFYKNRPIWRVELAKNLGAKVGKNCQFYSLNFFSEPYLIEIGDDVILSGEVKLVTHDGAVFLFKDEIKNVQGNYGRIKIGNNCFIGMGAIILPNVTIGDNCIISAGAVVMNSIPDNSVVMGNPAKVVFKSQMYKKLKQNSKRTIINPEYAHPTQIPPDVARNIIEKYFQEIPFAKIPAAKKKSKLND